MQRAQVIAEDVYKRQGKIKRNILIESLISMQTMTTMISTDKMTTEKETEMKTFKCEEMMCGGCVNRIKKGLDAADINNKVDLDSKTVTIDGCGSCEAKAVEILDGLGFSAVEV